MKFIYVIDKVNDLKIELEELFKSDKELKIKKILPNQIDNMLKNIPDIVVINEDNLEDDIIEYCKKIREDEDNSIAPIIVISSNKENSHIIEILKNEVEIYLTKPFDKEILYYNIKNVMRLLNSNRMVSPLTGLPGNVQIQAEMKKRLSIGNDYAMLYIDLDNF